MFTSRSLWELTATFLLLATTMKLCSARLTDHVAIKVANPSPDAILHQNIAANPPLPILDIGLAHILGQIGANATQAENQSVVEHPPQAPSSRAISLNARDSPVACGPNEPCLDGSCCNSEGKCGFTPYTCQLTATTTCISNCDAHAMCGVNSLNGAQKCPYNLCCSYFGYCGMSSIYCTDGVPSTMPCQPGYGSCKAIQPPACSLLEQTASRGRRVAYWQSGNVRYRGCNRIDPSHINTTGLTHLLFSFAAFDPITFQIVPVDRSDFGLYLLFTALKSAVMQTWIAIGGGGFTDPDSRTLTSWSDMCSTAAHRAAFIESLAEFMTKWGFSGVDLDWEYPTVTGRGGQPADFANFVALVREMRATYGTKFGISVSIPLDFANLMGYDGISLQSSIDFFNVMAYDLHGPWEASYNGAIVRAQTSILDITSGILPLWFSGIQPCKVNLGLASYGRGYKLANEYCIDVYCPYLGPSEPGRCTGSEGVLSLQEIQDLIKQKQLTPKLLPDQMVKQIVWDGNWMGYDDDETFAMKRQWADSHCIGGTVLWSVDFNSGVGSSINIITTTISGSCGLTDSGSKSCAGSTFGGCCSSHGYCGSGPLYCSVKAGCQPAYGTCSDQDSTVSVDGSCGSGKTCLGSPFGNCCSSHGYCGSTPAHCRGGCQGAFGTCG